MLISKFQDVVHYFQSNQVLGTLAFAYGFRDDGVARAPHRHFRNYAAMLEAFIDTVFTSQNGYAVGMSWLKALWSSRCFPDLKLYLKKHRRNKGQCHSSLRQERVLTIKLLRISGTSYKSTHLRRARALWQSKRQKALSRKTSCESEGAVGETSSATCLV